ncbi:hypothetical protein PF049_03605 [Erythrobacteraceae bacterium WH01K]|nr:hypothetical protein PF049_03605 [Erythrobacteraceae bacterium WH01K]
MTIWNKILGESKREYAFRMCHDSENFAGLPGVYIITRIVDFSRETMLVEAVNDLAVGVDCCRSMQNNRSVDERLTLGVLLCPQSDAEAREAIANDVRRGVLFASRNDMAA